MIESLYDCYHNYSLVFVCFFFFSDQSMWGETTEVRRKKLFCKTNKAFNLPTDSQIFLHNIFTSFLSLMFEFERAPDNKIFVCILLFL